MNRIDELINILESDLYLIGATAVEDKLQDMVPETIRDLLMAGIKLWMLTGDKLETAENIAKSCNLFTSNMIIFNLSKPNTQLSIEDIKSEIQFKIETINNRIYEMNINNEKKGLILDGATLCYILVDYKLMKMFAHMIENIESVVCCRVTPKQKADIVFIVKFFLQKITLSVGDGANDVNMIQEADIGVGIYGQEGIRAVQSSDFAIAEFKSLWKLILVHGRWSYLRIAEMVLYFFYKNMVFTIPHFFYGFYCSFSGQTIFDDYYISFYNLFFTCFPLMIKAVFEQDVYYKQLNYENNNLFVEELKYVKKIYPFLYFIGPQNLLFSTEKFLSSILRGLVHGFLIFYIIFFCFENTIVSIDGHYSDIWIISITLFTAIIIVVNLQLAIYTSLVLSCSIILSVEYCIRLYLTNKETVEKYFYEMVEQEKTKSIIKRNEEKIQFKMQNLSFKKSLKLVNTLNLSDNNKDISPSKSFSIAPNDLTFKAFLS